MSGNRLGEIYGPGSTAQDGASFQLNERAADHALLLAALWDKVAELQLDDAEDGYLSVLVWKHGRGRYFETKGTDPFGCPIISDALRASLKEAVGVTGETS